METTAKTQKVSLHTLYDTYNSHVRALDFYKEELQYLEMRLGTIVNANTGQEVLSQAEHFQNVFLITADNIAELKGRVQKGLQHIEEVIKVKPTHADEKTINDLGIYSRDLHELENRFSAMKLEFNSFLAKYL
ncbi:MAG: hypothetical protein JST76_09350 [Bacteroidetes bacterium]|nr:hypothetical protein [Bacteroidota bacterium]